MNKLVKLISSTLSFFLKLITIIPKYIITGIIFLLSETKQKELKLEKKIIPIIIITLSLTTYLLSIFIITRWYVQNERNKKLSENLNETTEIIKQEEITENTPDQYTEITTNETKNNENNYSPDTNFLNINLNNYINKNSETVAWLQVNGTNINYPVVQHKDNDYYLNHDFYNRKTNIGWVFADFRNNFEKLDNNTIIYAHNLINRTMFGQLPYLLKTNWQSNPNNHYIKLSTKTTNSVWQIFSIYQTKPITDYLQVKFNDIENYTIFLETLKNKSSYNFNTTITAEDKIITLSTCDDTGTKRVVAHAKLIKTENK